ncbi:MAG TPA: rhomboid family intramembrane serine protease [Burkholderiaceae bacterium]|jgi:membrane associated rhomboid family serine protease|nr:rhomboid family intramembrane serine protease [Burkholderiaceae bacterium]
MKTVQALRLLFMPITTSSNPQRNIKLQIALLIFFLGIMWGAECLNFLVDGRLDQYGIVPRSTIGLRGILFAPFLHVSFAHLITNSLPFFILGGFVMLRRTGDFLWVTAIVMLVGGLGTWLIAPADTVHVGASGVIFGYLGFLMARGYFERSLVSMVVSIAIGVTYGSLIWGVLPGQTGISWQGHFFGLLGGIMAARLLVPRNNDS